MAKLSNTKKKSNTKAKVDKRKSSESASSSSTEDESHQTGSNQKSPLLVDCEKAFGSNNLYNVLSLEKTASQSDIKKAYYRLSLKCHPDKLSNSDEKSKEDGKHKFQLIGKIYSILSDEEKRKLYDEAGLIDGEEEFLSGERDWEAHWRGLFKKISTNDIDKFFETYKDSDEEKKDLLRLYEQHKGDMDLIMEYMFSSDAVADEERFRNILNNAIENEELVKHDLYVNESKRKANKRKADFEKEAVEAAKLKKEMGLDVDQEGLKNMILSRRKTENDNFLDKLEKKYSKGAVKKAGGLKPPKNIGKKKKEVSEDEDDESQEEEDNESEDDLSEEEDVDSDEENEKPKGKKKSNIIKKNSVKPKKQPPTKSIKTNAKRVKRL